MSIIVLVSINNNWVACYDYKQEDPILLGEMRFLVFSNEEDYHNHCDYWECHPDEIRCISKEDLLTCAGHIFDDKHKKLKFSKSQLAEQQLVGWISRNNGDTLKSLVRSMRLTYEEWEHLKQTGEVEWMDYKIVLEIDELLIDELGEKDEK